MSKKICLLSIKYNLDCDGLIGGTHEYRPYLTWYGSFGKHRVITIDNLRPIDTQLALSNCRRRRHRHYLSATKREEEEDDKKSKEIIMDRTFPSYTESKSIEIELNDYDEMKGDDALMFKLFSHTRDSGVESIDKSESQFVERQTPGGLCHLSFMTFSPIISRIAMPSKRVIITRRDKPLPYRIDSLTKRCLKRRCTISYKKREKRPKR